MKLQIGRYILTQRVLRLLFFTCLLTGIIIGVLYALREDGKPILWLLFLPAMLAIARLIKDTYTHFKQDNDRP